MPGPTSTPSSRNPTVLAAADDFVKGLAAATGLDPGVLKAWVKVEGAYAPNGTGHFNFLNLRAKGGHGYSGVPTNTSPGGFAQFNTVDDAVTETAHWLNTMPNYAGIRSAAHSGPQVQLAAIAASPWDAGHYQGGRALTSAYAALTKAGGDWLGAIGHAAAGVGRGIIDAGSGNPIKGATDVVGGLPGSIPGVGAAQSVGDTLNAIGTAVNFGLNPQNWLRVGYIVGGGLFVLLGLALMAKSVGALNVVGPAAPELNLAGQAEKAAAASPYKSSREGISKKDQTGPSYDTGLGRRPRRSASTARAGEGIPF